MARTRLRSSRLLRAHGGAAFPASINWPTVLQGEVNQRYVVHGAHWGDSGKFYEELLPFSGEARFRKQNLRPNSIVPVNELSKCLAPTECPIAGVTIGIKYRIGSRSAIAGPYRIAMLAQMPGLVSSNVLSGVVIPRRGGSHEIDTWIRFDSEDDQECPS